MALSALIGAWLAGTLGGAHCLAMCGGFVAVMSGAANPAAVQGVPLYSTRALAFRQLAYNAGRIATYAVLGAAAGGAGGALLDVAHWVPLQRILFVVANLFLLALSVAIARQRDGFGGLQRVGHRLFGTVLPAVRPLLAANTVASRYAVGMIWGLVPCALTYSVLPIALFAGGAWQGAAVMLAFGIGTLPNLLAASWLMARAQRVLDVKVLRYAAASVLAGFAAIGIWRALFGAASLAQGPFCL